MRVAIQRQIAGLLPDDLPQSMAVAVSGGGDSTALLLLMQELAQARGFALCAVTVNHGLRREAAAEAEGVERLCASLGVPHDTLLWADWDGHGNMQNEARKARYRLIGDWARDRRVFHVALGHTLDDQAETVVMQMQRKAGIDGLSAMPAARVQHGVTWLRPLLRTRREDLRALLTDQGIGWFEDPSNNDMSFERIKIRTALEDIASIGGHPEHLALFAERMQDFRRSYEDRTAEAARKAVTPLAGGLLIDWEGYQAQETEVQRRLILSSLRWITGAIYPPRRASWEAAMTALASDQRAATLNGCLMRLKKGRIFISREYNPIKDKTCAPGALWDGRWRCTGPAPSPGHFIAALGDTGLNACPQWRDTGLPRDFLRVSPAVWCGPALVASPLVNPDGPWQAELESGNDTLFDAVFSH